MLLIRFEKVSIYSNCIYFCVEAEVNIVPWIWPWTGLLKNIDEMANSADLTISLGAVWSGSALFALGYLFEYLGWPIKGHGYSLEGDNSDKAVFASVLKRVLYIIDPFSERVWCARWQIGPSCSKLMMLSVNISLKLWSLNMAYMLIFLLKKCE